MANSEMSDYGFNVIIKEYAHFPKFLSLPCHWEHGWTPTSGPLNSDLATKKPLMLVFSTRRELAWKAESDIPVAIMGAPFILYRRMRGIKKKDNAKGTVAFPSHSCRGVAATFDVDEYCKMLRGLPEIFQPVTVCLHIDDFGKEKWGNFVQNGFNVVTAGDQFCGSFPKNFYDILSSHSFATSNVVGSYTLYAIDMKVPFFVWGELPVMENYGNDPNVPRRYSIADFPTGRLAQELFSGGATDRISEKQQRFVTDEIGSESGLSRIGMAILLWKFKTIELLLVVKKLLLAPTSLTVRLHRSRNNLAYLRRNDLIRENGVFTHLTIEEKIELHKGLRRYFGNRRIVCAEIGSYLGASTCFIAHAISTDSVLFCIDTWNNDAMKYDDDDTDTNPRDTYEEFRANTSKYADKVVEIRKRSSEAIAVLRDSVDCINFLFVDGDHDYDAVKCDWNFYSPLLAAGSIVVFHDTGWAYGVRKVIAESIVDVAEKVIDLPNMQGFRLT